MLANPLLPPVAIAADIPLYTVPGAGMLGKRMRLPPPADLHVRNVERSVPCADDNAVLDDIRRGIARSVRAARADLAATKGARA